MQCERLTEENEKLQHISEQYYKSCCKLLDEGEVPRGEYEDLKKDCNKYYREAEELRRANEVLEVEKRALQRRLDCYSLVLAEHELQKIRETLAGAEEIGEVSTVTESSVDDARMAELKEAKELADTLDSEVETLDLELRTLNPLKRANLNTIGEVCDCTATELLGLRNFGVNCLNDLNYQLALLDLSLKPERSASSERRIRRALGPSESKLLRLETLGLSSETYAEAKEAGFSLVGHRMESYKIWSGPGGWSEEGIRSKFKTAACADEFVAMLKERGFLLR